MEPTDVQETLALHSQNINGLMDNQLALVAQVQVLQAALASLLLHHDNRHGLLDTFEKYMKVSKDNAPQLASRMDALEAGIASLLGKHQA